MRRGWVVWALALTAALETGWLLYPVVRGLLLAIEDTPATRGHRLAAELGCFACHGPDGGGGTKNPGSQEGEVPAFTEQTQMMYVKTTDDLREYVLDGAPRRRREDPDYVRRMEAAAIRMPAYRAFVSARQLEDLVAYLRATSGQLLPPHEEAALVRGAELTAEHHCFRCHGPFGAGGVPNPGSFKGYIPGFWGDDYDDLVQSDEELRQWLADGEIARITEHPIGGWFFRRQAAKMPAYGRFLSPEDLAAMAAYVKWIRAGSWRARLQ
jgi:mono/diheme cytochrome c family protein